jgi:hypothetical protein
MPSPNIDGANFVALLSGIGFDGNIRPELLIFSLIIFCITFSFFRVKNNLENKELVFIFLCILGFSLKFITNPSINHIGWIFILLAIYFLLLEDLLNKYRLEKLLFVSACIAMLIITLPVYFNSNYFNKYKNVDYIKPEFSTLFKIDSVLSNKLKSSSDFDNYNYCIISKQDDAIAIYNNNNITSKISNLSTNINHYIDINKILKLYSSCDYLLIDKDLLRNDEIDFIKLYLYNRDERLNRFISGYFHDFNKMQFIVKSSISSRKLIKSNDYFELYR